MSTFKAVVAKTVVDSEASKPVIECMGHPDWDITGAAAWAIEHIAQHGEVTTGPLIEQGALTACIAASAR